MCKRRHVQLRVERPWCHPALSFGSRYGAAPSEAQSSEMQKGKQQRKGNPRGRKNASQRSQKRRDAAAASQPPGSAGGCMKQKTLSGGECFQSPSGSHISASASCQSRLAVAAGLMSTMLLQAVPV